MEPPIAIRLCGPLRIERAGLEVALPGRQGRLVLAFLVVNRHRAVARDELIDLLWPDEPPAEPGEALSAILSRMRRALGQALLPSGRQVELVLPAGVSIDLGDAYDALARAEEARDAEAAEESLRVTSRGFLVGDEAPWVEERRRDVDGLRQRGLEALAAACLELGGARLAIAEEAARALVEAAPFRESGHCLLMGALAARGDVAEALRVYDELRVRLRDELGTAPGAEAQAIHRRLLDPGETQPVPEPVAGPPHEERKVVSILCATPAGAERMADPEDLRKARRRLDEVAAQFGGTAGAGRVVFGAPVAHEDDAERAVMAALRLLDRGLATCAGIATGEAIVSPEGGAVGPVSAAAERLERSAAPGAIVVDEATRRATRRAVRYGPGRVVRGAAGNAPGRRARLVGRGPELDALRAQHAAAVAEARPRLVTILGQAGIGKSRLLEELLGEIEDSTLRGRCLPYGEGIAYWALREVLWEAAGIGLPDSAAEAAGKLRRTVGDLLAGPDVERVTAALAASAGIAMPGDEVSPETLADEIALAWPRFLGALAARSPVVVALEDLHWAEEPLIEMVQAILTRSAGPLLLVATARPELAEAHPGWGYRPGMSQLALEPLTRGEAGELVDELLPGADHGLAARVVASAEGNPFFVQEIVRHLAETPAEPGIPSTVRAVLAARIDALAAPEKRALQHAAVVGRGFWPAALRDMPGGEPGPELLRTLEERGFVAVRPASSLPEHRELWFAHGLTREVAYRSLPRAERCLAHAAVARWLEGLAGDRREEFVELLAHHLEAAVAPGDAQLAWPEGTPEELRAKAVRALVEAGDAARRRHSSEQALRFAARALALAASPAERLAAVELRARSYAAVVRVDDALESFEEGLELAAQAGDAEARSRLRGLALLMCVRYMGAFTSNEWLDRVEAMADQGFAETAEDAVTLDAGALLLWRAWGGDRRRARELGGRAPTELSTAKRQAARSIEIAEAVGSSVLHAVALEGLTWITFKEGLAEAGELGERHLRAAATLADHVEAHESYTTAAVCFANAGDFAAAGRATAQAIAQAARLSPHRALHAAAAGSLTFVPTGRFAELLDATGGLEELAAFEGERLCATGAMGLAGRCLALHEAGDPAEARAFEVLRAAVPASRWLGWGHPLAELLRPAVPVEETRERIRSSGRPPQAWLNVRRLRTELPLHASSRDWAALDDAIAQARTLAVSATAPALDSIADWASGARLVADGRGEEAVVLAEAATAALHDAGERYTAARLMAELLALLRGDAPGPLVEQTAETLVAMGAHASAALARDGDAQAVSR